MKAKLIFQEAKEVKKFIEKNKTMPKYCTINNEQISIYTASYLFAKLLNNLKATDITLMTVKAPTNTNRETINEKITSPDYRDMNKRYVQYCEQNKRLPSYVKTYKSEKKVSYDLYTYCLCKILTYYIDHSNTLPLYCEFKTTDLQKTTTVKKTTTTCTNPYTSTPHYLSEGCNKLGQCTGWWCGPHSIHQAMRKLGVSKYTESQIASWAGTTRSGTGHPGLNTAIAKIGQLTGIKFKVQWKNFSDMGSNDEERFKAIAKILCDPNKAIIWHIAYINGGAGTTGTHFGHYECIDKINTATKYVRALNSLGNKKSDGSYNGHLQDRKYSIQAYFARNTPGGQQALCIITKGE